jgi:prepilin-type N-terminal cleavage/methylation domain-containing protein
MFRLTNRSSQTAAFTLVEMLVVIGIIAILAALLLPAVNSAIVSARNTAIALEIKQLDSALETYRLEKGDYPPNFRNMEAVRRHIMKCYPRIDPMYFQTFMTWLFPSGSVPATPGSVVIDEAESLVFWLSMTDKNPQYPFLPYTNPGTVTTAALPPFAAFKLPQPDPKIYYDFDQTRLLTAVNADVKSFVARYCKESFYIYIDARSYDNSRNDLTDLCRFAAADGTPPGDTYGFADDTQTGVRPYWSTTQATGVTKQSTLLRDGYKPMNPNTFQIICAGQDGDFGTVLGSGGDADVKVFPSGLNYNQADKDNITNFSGGRTLGNSIP